MMAHSGVREPAGLTGRLSERDVLDRVVADVRAGQGRAQVVRGEPGVGKSAGVLRKEVVDLERSAEASASAEVLPQPG